METFGFPLFLKWTKPKVLHLHYSLFTIHYSLFTQKGPRPIPRRGWCLGNQYPKLKFREPMGAASPVE